MFKIDQVKNVWDCEYCNNLLVNPVTIVCGYSVCMKHLDELVENSSDEVKYKCFICPKQHTIPEEGFVINRRLQKQLDLELNKFKPSQAYEDCKKEINDAKDYVAKIEALEKDPETYIYDYFEEIKRKVDLRREEIKSKVDNFSDEIINSIESSKENCVRLAKEGKILEIDIKKQKKELDELLERFDRFDFNEQKFHEIKDSVALLNKDLNKKLEAYKIPILDNKTYAFKIDEDIEVIEDIFGGFKVIDNFVESSILDRTLRYQLDELCEFPKDREWKLIYKASRDGFKASDFHAKCDYHSGTLTVIKSESGNVFGGFTEQAWSNYPTNGEFVADPSAFIFSLVNKDKNPFKVKCSNDGQYGIFTGGKYGPVFGGDGEKLRDIVIKSDSNTLNKSYTDFGYAYQHPDYQRETVKAKYILAGSFEFHIEEIEVYKIDD